MAHKDLVQGTEEWKMARCGSLGASSLHEVLAKTRTGWGAGRANIMARLIAEKLSGVPQETYQSAAMVHGIETEPEARATYAFLTDENVEEVGIFPHPTIEGSHASPDGLVNEDGLVEIKCPNTSTHIDYLLKRKIPKKYETQMQWQLACTNRQWCDFVSYDPRLPGNLSIFIQRLERDDKWITELESDVNEFLAELSTKVDQLRKLMEES